MQWLVIDDGSSDQSLEILRCCDLPHQLLQQPRQGPAAARNLALQQACWEWVAFLDADDLWPEGSLGRRLKALREQPQWACLSGRLRTFCEDDLHPRLLERHHDSPRFAVNLGAALFRRGALEQVGGFRPQLRFDEDTDLWMRLWEAGFDKGWLAEVTLLYRLHGHNLTVEAPSNAKALLPLLKAHRERAPFQPNRQDLATYLGWKAPGSDQGQDCQSPSQTPPQ